MTPEFKKELDNYIKSNMGMSIHERQIQYSNEKQTIIVISLKLRDIEISQVTLTMSNIN